MNLALPAVLLLLLLMPGLLYRRAYLKGSWTYPLGRLGPLSEQIFQGLFHALWINAVWLWLVGVICGKTPDVDACVRLATNTLGEKATQDRVFRELARQPVLPLLYFFGLHVFAIGLGLIFHFVVRWTKLDRRRADRDYWKRQTGPGTADAWMYPLMVAFVDAFYSMFRFDNEWHYLLRGEAPEFVDKKSAPDGRGDLAAILVMADVEAKDAVRTYLGTVSQFFFDAAGNLDTVILEDAYRRTSANPVQPAEPIPTGSGPDHPTDSIDAFDRIPGKYVVLKYSDCVLIRIVYVYDYLVNEVLGSVESTPVGENRASATRSPES